MTKKSEEVKFCKNCGKQLKANETCDCEKEVKGSSTNSNFDFVATMVEIKDDLIKSIKNPIDEIKNAVKNNNMPKTYIILAVLSITFGLFIAGLMKAIIPVIMASMGGGLGAVVSSKIKLPYAKIILYFTIIMAITLAAYALVMLIVQAIFKNKKIDFKEGLTLTTAAYLPMIIVNLVCAILGFLGLDIRFVLIVYLIANVAVTYNFAYAYAKHTDVEDNKFGYVIATLVIISGLISGIASYALTKNMVEGISGNDIVDTSDLEDLDDWDF